MKTYQVTITEKLELTVAVEASSRFEAERLVEQQYKRCDHVLNADHFTGVEFKAVPPQKQRGMDR
jgi:hypothetical protein